MLVIHAIDYRASKAGSFIASLYRLTSQLSQRGVQSLVVAPETNEEQPWAQAFAASGVEVVKTPSYAALSAIVTKRRPDIVHAHFSGYIVPATLASLATKTRVIWHVHSAMLSPRSPLRKANRALKYRILSRRANAILTVSERLQQELLSLGVPRSRLSVVDNAVDTNHFRLPTPDERQTARRFLGLENGRRALLFFGRDSHIKGADLFASALEQLPEGPAVICVASPREVVSMIAQHAKVISTGIVADPRPFYWAADALAMPSRHEGTPLTLLEARATGLPAIVSTIPAFEDVASKDEGVIVSDHLDPRAFARSLMEPLERRPISAAARENISLDAWCQKVFAHYAMSPLGLSAIS